MMHVAWIKLTKDQPLIDGMKSSPLLLRIDQLAAMQRIAGRYRAFTQLYLAAGQYFEVVETPEQILEKMRNAISQTSTTYDATRADQLSQRFLAKHDPTRESRGSDVDSDVGGTARNSAECQRDLDPSGAVQ